MPPLRCRPPLRGLQKTDDGKHSLVDQLAAPLYHGFVYFAFFRKVAHEDTKASPECQRLVVEVYRMVTNLRAKWETGIQFCRLLEIHSKLKNPVRSFLPASMLICSGLISAQESITLAVVGRSLLTTFFAKLNGQKKRKALLDFRRTLCLIWLSLCHRRLYFLRHDNHL